MYVVDTEHHRKQTVTSKAMFREGSTMFGFFNRNQNRTARPDAQHSELNSALHAPQQQNPDVRRELIRVVLKNTLRLHGIAPEWLTCDVFSVPRAGGPDELHIQLVIKTWNEQLLRYAYAFEAQLRHELNRFDPSTDHSDCAVSWRFSSACRCPLKSMPDPASWSKGAPPAVPPAPTDILDRRKSVRPKEAPIHKKHRGDDDSGDGFASTTVAPL